jgi:DNA-binding transcriptional regulator GbsR (MarR family)
VDKPKGHRRTWGSVKTAVYNRRFMTASEIAADTGISRYSVYYAARRLGFILPRDPKCPRHFLTQTTPK